MKCSIRFLTTKLQTILSWEMVHLEEWGSGQDCFSQIFYIWSYRSLSLRSTKKCLERKNIKWVKVFKNGPSTICGRQPLKNFTWSILEYLDPKSSLYCIRKSKWKKERFFSEPIFSLAQFLNLCISWKFDNKHIN